MIIEILRLWMINLIRQVSYKYNSLFKSPEEFIDAWESKRLHREKRYIVEVLKELLLSSSFVILYLFGPGILSKIGAWLIFGITVDSFIDVFIAFRGNFYRFIKNDRMREFVRECFIPYILFATMFVLLNIHPIKFLEFYSIIIPLEFCFLLIIHKGKPILF